jgi:hypothetical protein
MLSATLLAGCTYVAPVDVTPTMDVVNSYGSKLPGSYLLYVNGDQFAQSVVATGYGCSAHDYPLDAGPAFRTSADQTVQQLVDAVQVVDQPVPASELAASDKVGMISVEAQSLQARFVVLRGLASATVDANVDMTATVTVDGRNGRLFGTTVEGSGNAQSDAGLMCGGAATALGEATQKAMDKLLAELGDRVSNSERLRNFASPEPK